VEEAGSGGSKQLRRAARGSGHGDVLAWRRRRVLLLFFLSIRFGFGLGLLFSVFWGLSIHSCRRSWAVKLRFRPLYLSLITEARLFSGRSNLIYLQNKETNHTPTLYHSSYRSLGIRVEYIGKIENYREVIQSRLP
jgi:hypothetical protein